MSQSGVSESTSKNDVAVASGAPSDESTATGTTNSGREGSNASSLCVVIASLIFVGVFGGSLIGGLITGDPNNVYFIIIVVFATLAIGIAGTIVFQNIIAPSFPERTLEPSGKREDLRKTFTAQSNDEQNDDHIDGEVYRRQSGTPGIKEISAGSVVGEMSALSPYTYDEDGYSRRRGDDPSARGGATPTRRRMNGPKRKGPFDFASIASSRGGRRTRRTRGEDPPEDDVQVLTSDSLLHQAKVKDPAAPKVSAKGNLIREDEGPSAHTRASTLSRQVNIGYDTSKTPTNAVDVEEGKPVDIHSLVRIRSIKTMAGTPREPSVHNRNDPDEEVEEVEVEDLHSSANSVPPPPPPPPQVKFRPPLSTKSQNNTGAASEVGSTVSSIFFKPFNAVFGKKKATTSEAAYSEASSYMKGSEAGFSGYNNSAKQEPSPINSSVERFTPVAAKEAQEQLSGIKDTAPVEVAPPPEPPAPPAPVDAGKPPRVDRPNNTLDTIDGGKAVAKRGQNEDRYSSIGDGQSDAVGSTTAPSEFKSVVGSSVFSGAASSTFDPQAHTRALQMVQANAFSLGAQPVVEQTSSGMYDEESSTGGYNQPGTYDVLAPPGAIGLVVDTAKQGPVVHSLKKNSPMIGLINPGDLIVALDDQDVRKMNAASLTRLMAKKSKQPERKFTLMPIEEY